MAAGRAKGANNRGGCSKGTSGSDPPPLGNSGIAASLPRPLDSKLPTIGDENRETRFVALRIRRYILDLA